MLDLDHLIVELRKSLSDGYIEMMYEAHLVTMNSYGLKNACNINPYTHSGNILISPFSLNWKKVVTALMIKTHRNENQTTDFGTMFISLAIILRLPKLKKDCGINNLCFETSVTGTGIDFWIADETKPLNFKAQIEISGIKRATATNNIKTRLKEKIERFQRIGSPTFPLYISIVEYSHLQSLIYYN